MKVIWIVLGFAIVAVLAGWFYKSAPSPVRQPLPFNHKKHMETSKCSDCHRFYETQAFAGIPTNEDCLGCHEDPMSKSPEEERQRKEYWEAGREIPWVRVNRLPEHTFYSHVAHVRFAKIDCAECHGNMKEQTEPVTTPQIGHLTMSKCMACHRERGVNNDCYRCHK